MTKGIAIIPELAVRDLPAARAMLADVFGFSGNGDLLTLGSQTLALVPAEGTPGHGKIDHLALAVADVPAALAACRARGARLEATTPDGPRQIAEFWDHGVEYVFLQGPEGARLEFCARLDTPAAPGLPGHDHIGIPCTDIAATEAFFTDLGLVPVAAVDLYRPDGVTAVRFLRAGASVVELYAPPQLQGAAAPFAENALWRGLRLTGTALPKGARLGPDGLRLTVV